MEISCVLKRASGGLAESLHAYRGFDCGSKVRTGVEGCKTKSFRGQTHTPAIPAALIQAFDVVWLVQQTKVHLKGHS